MGLEILATDSPRWDEFADALYEVTRIPGDPEAWRCDGDNLQAGNLAYRYAKLVMTAMGNVDIPASIEFFQRHGGYCDCEILFNVDRPD
jgi:hypothetical protein